MPIFKHTVYTLPDGSREARLDAIYPRCLNDEIEGWDNSIPDALFNELERYGYFNSDKALLIIIEQFSKTGKDLMIRQQYRYKKGVTEHNVEAFRNAFDKVRSSFRRRAYYPPRVTRYKVTRVRCTIYGFLDD